MKRYRYDYERDSYYCYPGSCILKNKLNIRDEEKLHRAEREITSVRMAQILQKPVQGALDFSHLKSIHRHIFKDIYTWAGKTRNVNISKGSPFCRFEFIEEQANAVFEKIRKEHFLDGCTKEEAARKLARYLGDINAVHPFREGNGRAQRMYIEYLALTAGYDIDFSSIGEDEMVKASAEAFGCDYGKMEELMIRCISRLPEEEWSYYRRAILGNRGETPPRG